MLRRILYIFQIVILLHASSAFASELNYSMIIDAGSSGSRLHIYQYQHKDNQHLPAITDIFSKKIKPGLSAFADHPEKAGPSLKPLLDEAINKIRQQQIEPNKVKLSILATAGMRLLPVEKQQKVYQAVKKYIQKHYAFTISKVETVPEKMEGVYGWLDVNYLANNFDQVSNQTEGTLDLGGASLEITLAVAQSSDPENEMNLTVNGKNYIVFSRSFLGLGKDQATAAMDKYANAPLCYPAHYTLSSGAIGNYQFTNCKNMYADIIAEHHVAELHPDISQQHFTAFSAFYFVSHFFDSDQNSSKNHLEQKVTEVCAQSWEQLKQNHSDVPDAYLSTYCASGAYISHLLYDTYQFSDDQVTFSNQVSHQDIDWPLGALLFSLL